VLFLGPPGTAKSLLSKSVCEAIDGYFFYYLLTRFTTPEEVFGPLSLKALQRDDFRRRTEGYLPAAHVAFLDEIFKSNSSILNSLLTILNERKFTSGNHLMDVPLLTAFGASNEMPEDNESLEALYDRFLFRCSVKYVEDETNFADLIFGPDEAPALGARLSIEDIRDLQERAKKSASMPTCGRSCSRHGGNYGPGAFSSRTAAGKDGRRHEDSGSQHRPGIGRPLHGPPVTAHGLGRPEQKEHIKNMLMDLMISGGESLKKLKKEADDLLTLVQRSVDFRFPMRIRCYDCSEMLESSKKLYVHRTIYPEHRYYDPYRISLHLRYFGYSELLKVLQEEYGWNFVENTPRRLHDYLAEMAGIRDRHAQARVKVEEEVEKLKCMLDTNVWVTKSDRTAVMSRCHAKINVLHDIGRAFSIIESMIEQDGQVSLMDRAYVFEAEAQ